MEKRFTECARNPDQTLQYQRRARYADPRGDFEGPEMEFIDRLVPLLPSDIAAETSFVASEMSARAGLPVGQASLKIKISYAVYKFSAGADIVQTYKAGKLSQTRLCAVSQKTSIKQDVMAKQGAVTPECFPAIPRL